MKPKHMLLAMSLTLVMSSPGFDQQPMTVIDVIDHLDEAVRDCDWKARNLTGAPKLKMLLHKRTMEDVLEGLKAGRIVASRKLEDALKEHSF